MTSRLVFYKKIGTIVYPGWHIKSTTTLAMTCIVCEICYIHWRFWILQFTLAYGRRASLTSIYSLNLLLSSLWGALLPWEYAGGMSLRVGLCLQREFKSSKEPFLDFPMWMLPKFFHLISLLISASISLWWKLFN